MMCSVRRCIYSNLVHSPPAHCGRPLLGIGESEWAFRTTFDVRPESLKEDSADLVFEGLDTYATVELVRVSQCMLTAVVDTHFRFHFAEWH